MITTMALHYMRKSPVPLRSCLLGGVCHGLPAEKNITAIKQILASVPGCRLALVGDGPQRAELEQLFKGDPVVFMVGAPWPHAGAGLFCLFLPGDLAGLLLPSTS